MAFTAGQKLRASELNAALTTPLFKVTRTSTASVADGNTTVPLAWQAHPIATDTVWSSLNPTIVTIARGGVWLLVVGLRFAATTGNKAAYVTKNGTALATDAIVASTGAAGGTSILQATGVVALSAGDVLRVYPYQLSGAAMNLSTDYGGTYFTGARLGA